MNDEEERYRRLATEVSALANGAASAITADSIRRATPARRHALTHSLSVHRVATVSFVVALVVAAVVVVAAPSPHSSIVAVETGATPSGWVAVDYGDAQISVPSGWNARYDTSCDVPQAPGSVFVGSARVSDCLGNGDAEAPHVHIGPTSGPLETAPISRKTVNGIAVLEISHDSVGTSYVVPALGVSLQLIGAAAQRVLVTLTYSPRAVVLSGSPAPTVPSSWHLFSFAGLGFAAPSSWPRDVGSSYARGCAPGPVGFSEEIVSLSTDTRLLLPSAAGCVYVVPPLKATDGVSVNAIAARVVPAPSQLATHCLDIHGLAVCPYADPAFGILYLRVSGPQLPRAVMVEIGLAGSGSTARTILGSLRPATGTVEGVLEMVGGSVGSNPTAVGGTVTLSGSAGTYTVKAAGSGRFTDHVPAGTYEISGHSPQFGGGEGICHGSDVDVKAGEVTDTGVYCPRS